MVMICRQKIDEAPTPFRYGSESDQSEAESGSSDGEHLTRRRKVSAGSFDQANPDPDTVTNTANNSQAASHLAHKYAQHSVLYQWEAVHAKLTYEKHLQEQQQLQQQQQQQLSSADAQATMMVCDDGPEVPPPPPMQAYPFPSLTAISYDDNTVGDEGDGHDDDDDHLGFDPPTTDFGELVSSPTAHGSTLLVAPPPPPPLPPAHGGKPVRPALKSSSLMLATGASPTKLSMKRSSSQELQLQLQLQQQQQQQQLQHMQLGPKPHKHVHIRTQLPTTVHLDTSSPDTPSVGVAFPSSSSSSSSSTAAAVVGMTPSSGLLNATTPTYASVVSTGGNNAYFRYSNPEGYHTTQHSALFAGINASMGGGHDRDLLGDDDDDEDEGGVDSEKKSSSTTLHRRISEEMQPAPSHDAQDPPGEDGLAAGSGDKQQFRNKRAGHYNEYKVLMAMRAKMMAEDEDDEDDD